MEQTKGYDGFFDLQLVVTKKCNLHCKYCYVRQEDASMSLETAQEWVRKGLEAADSHQLPLMVSFMGGEPLLAFPMIRELCEWAWASFPDREITFYSPTNGTLLDDEMKRWLKENKTRFTLALSYDSELFQDINRTRYAFKTEVGFFLECWPEQRFKMTISESNMSDLASAIISMESRRIPFAANLAFGEPEWQESSFALFEREMQKLVIHYSERPELPLCDLLDMDFRLALLPPSPMLRRCGIGQNYINVDCNGKGYPCHMISPLTVDEPTADAGEKYDFANRISFDVAGCEACALNQMCPKCYGMSYLRYGDPFRIDVNVCRTFQITARAAMILIVRMLHKKGELSEDEVNIVSGIKRVVRIMGWDLSTNRKGGNGHV